MRRLRIHLHSFQNLGIQEGISSSSSILFIHLHSFQNLGIQEVSSDKNLKIRTAAVSTLEISSEKNLKIRTAAVSTLEISSDKNLKIRTAAVSTLEIREVSNSCPQGAAEKERWRQLEAMRKLPVQWVAMILRRWQNKKSDRGCDIGNQGFNVILSDADSVFHSIKAVGLFENVVLLYAEFWKVIACDICEIAKNSVYQSGFSHALKVWTACGSLENPKLTYTGDVKLRSGSNKISLLSASVGLPNVGEHFETCNAGVLGPVTLNGLNDGRRDLTWQKWSYQIGLKGEELKLHSLTGSSSVEWGQASQDQPITWYKHMTMFEGLQLFEQLFDSSEITRLNSLANNLRAAGHKREFRVETESKDQWNYRFLGISESGKGDYEFPQVLSLLFSVLKKTIQKNESSPDSTTRKANDTIDHGLRSQELSIQSYTKRIFKYSNCSHSCFILAHVYIDRYLVQPGVHLSCLNVHR
ncbi:uncharacterized protein A4U43_C01F25370 [Asparagus officinalis]|uniref:Uncharacterized protein n=1 Tax=Asparagus officinalis TaxID=4686 RepID=A0A5P1FS19_ASPOF|nr:uncharacterized protein A4U43_C01F25370 [Asparagus officinalis]